MFLAKLKVTVTEALISFYSCVLTPSIVIQRPLGGGGEACLRLVYFPELGQQIHPNMLYPLLQVILPMCLGIFMSTLFSVLQQSVDF